MSCVAVSPVHSCHYSWRYSSLLCSYCLHVAAWTSRQLSGTVFRTLENKRVLFWAMDQTWNRSHRHTFNGYFIPVGSMNRLTHFWMNVCEKYVTLDPLHSGRVLGFFMHGEDLGQFSQKSAHGKKYFSRPSTGSRQVYGCHVGQRIKRSVIEISYGDCHCWPFTCLMTQEWTWCHSQTWLFDWT